MCYGYPFCQPGEQPRVFARPRRNMDTNATSKLLVTCDCDEAEELAVRFEVDGRAVPRDIRQDGRDDAYEWICDAWS